MKDTGIMRNSSEHTFPRKSNLYIYLTVLGLLICSRFFDIFTTHLVTPDLSGESNFLVRYLGFGWTNLYIINLAIIAAFSLLFAVSWSEFAKSEENGNHPLHSSIGGFVTRNEEIDSTGFLERKVAYEIGITLPIYVIITGYFQGVVNIMIFSGFLVISFLQSQFVYPVMIGGIFGIISHYFAKRLLYARRWPRSEKPHKVMVTCKFTDAGINKPSNLTVSRLIDYEQI
jgi:hypothetical protein